MGRDCFLLALVAPGGRLILGCTTSTYSTYDEPYVVQKRTEEEEEGRRKKEERKEGKKNITKEKDNQRRKHVSLYVDVYVLRRVHSKQSICRDVATSKPV